MYVVEEHPERSREQADELKRDEETPRLTGTPIHGKRRGAGNSGEENSPR